MVSSETAGVVDAGAPIGPGEAEESAFLAEQRITAPAPIAGSKAAETDEKSIAFPPMDELIQRIPAPTRELVDQLFRAKFVTVKRLPASALKTQI